MSLAVSSHLHVSILKNPADALPIWQTLLASTPASIYQRPEFLLTWLEDYGRMQGVEPLFIQITDESGPLLLLPLGISRIGPLKVGHYLGDKHANFNLPIFAARAHDQLGDNLRGLLKQGGREAGLDLLALKNQPREWDDIAHPFTALQTIPSPSFGYQLALEAEADQLIARLMSKERRKKFRQKQNRLLSLGRVEYIEAEDAITKQAMLDCYFAQKAERFAAMGIRDVFSDPAIRTWFSHLSSMEKLDRAEMLRLFGLRLDGQFIAIWGIGQHHAAASAMITSFAALGEIAKTSPGELLLEWIIRRLCAEGLSHLDFGVGEAHYKSLWSDTTISLFDLYMPISTAGQIICFALRGRTRLKRRIKQSPRLMEMISRVRRIKTIQ